MIQKYMDSKDNSSSAPGGESSADYIISESGEQQQQTSTKGKKSGLESLTDTVKEKVMGTAKSVKEGVSSTIGTNDNADDGKDLESAQVQQDRIGEASSDPKTTGPTDKVRQKASETTDQNQDTKEPA
jgi:hypothetical protein